MVNTKLSAFLSLLLVFLSGAVVGVCGYRVYNTSIAPPARAAEKQNPEDRRRQLIAETTREVQLDPDQVAKLGRIYDETRVRFDELNRKRNVEARAIWDAQVAQIEAFLRPDQVVLYEKLRARKEAERQANDRKMGRRKGPPPGDK
jgi:hypothetical protein